MLSGVRRMAEGGDATVRAEGPEVRLARLDDRLSRRFHAETQVAQGHHGAVVSQEGVLAAASLRAAGPARSGTPGGLTDREVEVLTWLARGKTNKEIGQLLDISPRTVQNHIASIYDKLGLYSRAGATLFAVENQLL